MTAHGKKCSSDTDGRPRNSPAAVRAGRRASCEAGRGIVPRRFIALAPIPERLWSCHTDLAALLTNATTAACSLKNAWPTSL
jgi:hypothetical protein